MHIFVAVFAAIIAAGIVLQALAGEPAARGLLRGLLRVLGIGMAVIAGLVLVLYLANVAQHSVAVVPAPQLPAWVNIALTVIFFAGAGTCFVGLGLLTVIVVIARVRHELATPHVLTKLAYSSTDAAFCEEPARNYRRLGH